MVECFVGVGEGAAYATGTGVDFFGFVAAVGVGEDAGVPVAELGGGRPVF